jgi:hypothetical protein
MYMKENCDSFLKDNDANVHDNCLSLLYDHDVK